jgi:hypothetical protein
MKEFNLERALAGMKIVDQDGYIGEYKLTNIHKGIKTHLFQFSVNDDQDQAIISYKEGVGWFYGFGKRAEKCEEYIGMAPVKKQEWVNIYSNRATSTTYGLGDIIFSTKEEAEACRDTVTYVTTVLIREWEE